MASKKPPMVSYRLLAQGRDTRHEQYGKHTVFWQACPRVHLLLRDAGISKALGLTHVPLRARRAVPCAEGMENYMGDRDGPHIVLKARQFLPLSLAPSVVGLPGVRLRLRDPQREAVDGERES